MASSFEDAKLILTPNAYKAGKAYCVKPFDGSGDFTVVRNTTATRIDENGLIEVVGANVPKLNYPIGGGCPSWLIEPQATNLLTVSEQFDNTSWAKQNVTVTPNAITAPDGNLTADKLVEDSSFSLHRTFKTPSCTSSTTYTASIFVKKAERTRFELKETTLGGCIFDLENGAILSGTDGFIESYGDDWYRCGIKKTTGASQTVFVLQIVLIEGLTRDYQGDGTSGIYIWGAQLEQGNLTSYIPTNGTAVTRNADVFNKTGISSLIGQTEGTVYIHAKKLGGSEQSALSYFSLSDSSSSNRLRIISGATPNTLRCIFQVNGNQLTFDYNNVVFNIDGENKLSFRYKSGDMAFFLNGVKIGDSSASLTISNTLDLIGFTNQIGGNELDTVCEYQSLILFDVAKTDAELINLTTI